MKIYLIENGTMTPVEDIEITIRPPANGFYWIQARLFDLDILQHLFHLHPLAIEDCIDEEEQRPKLEVYHDHYFIVSNSIQFQNEDIFLREVNIFLGGHYVITVSKFDIDEIRIFPSIIREEEIHSSDFFLYFFMDQLIESYFDVMEEIQDLIENLEEQVLLKAKNTHLSQIVGLRREILYAKKMMAPQRDLIHALQTKELSLISLNLRKYFVDIHENAVKIVENFETFRELIGNVREAYQSSVSNRTNEIMRIFTALTTIFMPLTVVTGIYGMNFDVMPELHTNYGYFIVLIIMFTLATTMYVIFKKRDWL
ncbi:magnesium/cobalt transporter CorA [Brevibacillus laterosporus]|uniref:Magnesium transport protein CorA n=1 Tax=Brevibacillus laterosporus LMG 15441 TaxID=1042163 RepID=A0A075R942_BRELA|nr:MULTISPECIES: magnesium/cobalt transporter CorA [Brevibacillus]HAS01078.1 magnesium and cobalt transport protein CorA [Brevibacillus sp.]AIG28389.1 magnesium transport protein CorA [Brevibacillus laterosporus LMG 15441]MCR8966103.1 magnesium/cobalt transporter CorA [Brevibacillus laterosporus]MCZ0838260.1 magnesium/cobalt transporter CorA [Brevibacillus halotolerans]MDF9414076.1 magnesium/cobalt transporter CorA [Brevibacillus laterosporus]